MSLDQDTRPVNLNVLHIEMRRACKVSLLLTGRSVLKLARSLNQDVLRNISTNNSKMFEDEFVPTIESKNSLPFRQMSHQS